MPPPSPAAARAASNRRSRRTPSTDNNAPAGASPAAEPALVACTSIVRGRPIRQPHDQARHPANPPAVLDRQPLAAQRVVRRGHHHLPRQRRRLRDLTRSRKEQINERTRAIQRIEKVVQYAGIKLTSVASQTYSKSARAMLEALLSGMTEPEQLAELAKGRMRAKIPQLREALQSRFKVDHHGIMVAQLIAHIDTLDQAIALLDEKIEAILAPHQQIVELLCTIPGARCAPRRC